MNDFQPDKMLGRLIKTKIGLHPSFFFLYVSMLSPTNAMNFNNIKSVKKKLEKKILIHKKYFHFTAVVKKETLEATGTSTIIVRNEREVMDE